MNIPSGILFSRLPPSVEDEAAPDGELDDGAGSGFRRTASLRVLHTVTRGPSPTHLPPAPYRGVGSFYRLGSLRAYNRSVFDFDRFDGSVSPGRGRPAFRSSGRGSRASSLPTDTSRAMTRPALLCCVVAALKGKKDGLAFASAPLLYYVVYFRSFDRGLSPSHLPVLPLCIPSEGNSK